MREREGISATHDEESSAVSPNSPSTVRVSPSPPFLAEDSLFTSGDIGGASGDSPELDSDPLWKDRHTHISCSRNIHMYMYMCTHIICNSRYIHMYMYIYMYMCTHTCNSRHIHMYMYMCIFLELCTCTCTIVEGTLEIKSWGLLIHKVKRAITQRSKSRLVEMAGSVAICNIL